MSDDVRDDNHRRYDGPVPRGAWLHARQRPEPGTRQASAARWSTVRYWAIQTRASTRGSDMWRASRSWLAAAFESWKTAREEERSAEASRNRAQNRRDLAIQPAGYSHLIAPRRRIPAPVPTIRTSGRGSSGRGSSRRDC